jgi:hypothetical protein
MANGVIECKFYHSIQLISVSVPDAIQLDPQLQDIGAVTEQLSSLEGNSEKEKQKWFSVVTDISTIKLLHT